MTDFYTKYYNDHNGRIGLFGINPGRFGAGQTGIPFTDPLRLSNECGIPNELKQRQELSSVFVYRIVEEMGGLNAFYGDFYISSVSPIGFIKEGKNCNYYDQADLQNSLEGFIINHFQEQLDFGLSNKVVYSIGKGKNYKYLKLLNEQFNWFKEVKALPHPRWVMQYRLRQSDAILSDICSELQRARKYLS